jgi:hypothetical protein
MIEQLPSCLYVRYDEAEGYPFVDRNMAALSVNFKMWVS